MTSNDYTTDQIRAALKGYKLGPAALADQLCPGLARDARKRFIRRIKRIKQREPSPSVPMATPRPAMPLPPSVANFDIDLSRDEFLRRRIEQLDYDIENVRQLGHTNALTNLMREQRTCVTELDELTKTQEPADEFEGMHGMELIQPICDALRDPDFPEVIAEAIADSLRDRYGGNVVPFKSRQ